MLFLIPVPVLLFSSSLDVKLTKKFEIGEKQVTFSNKVSLAQDRQENIYVMDAKRHKIYTFSPAGQFLREFGKMGRGPGDFYRPQHITVTKENRLVISDVFSVSTLDLNGNCLEKIRVSRVARMLQKKYAGNDLILALKMMKRNISPPLVLVSIAPEVKVVNDKILECSTTPLYKEAGIFHDSISPEIWFDCSGGRSVAALSEKYLVKIIGPKGEIEKTIKKNIKNPRLSKKERNFIIETEINSWKGIDQAMKNGLKTTIPDVKNVITGITLSKSKIFVRRIRPDITKLDAPVPVDIYTIGGDFLGMVHLPSFPLLATDRYFYFKKETGDGDILISKYDYRIVSKNN